MSDSKPLSDDDKKLLGLGSSTPARDNDGSLKSPELAEQDHQDQVRAEQLAGQSERPKNARRRKSDEDKDTEKDAGDKERLNPAQYDTDGHEEVPAQFSFETPKTDDSKDS